jgi:hypothetical protein
VIDDHLPPAVIEIPIAIAPSNDDSVAIAVIATFTNDFAFANDVTVAMALTDGHADRAHADADFFRRGRQCGPDQRSSRYRSKTKFHVSPPDCPLRCDNPAREQKFRQEPFLAADMQIPAGDTDRDQQKR